MPSQEPKATTRAYLDLIESCTRVIRNVLLAVLLLLALLSSPLLNPRGCRMSGGNKAREVKFRGSERRDIPGNAPTPAPRN